jgi:hypothetical protein
MFQKRSEVELKFINIKKSNELNEAQSPMWVINIFKWACLQYSLGFFNFFLVVASL